eukprot:scaffold123044_cov42-Phaeocystis_antarctica.AAC.2
MTISTTSPARFVSKYFRGYVGGRRPAAGAARRAAVTKPTDRASSHEAPRHTWARVHVCIPWCVRAQPRASTRL